MARRPRFTLRLSVKQLVNLLRLTSLIMQCYLLSSSLKQLLVQWAVIGNCIIRRVHTNVDYVIYSVVLRSISVSESLNTEGTLSIQLSSQCLCHD